MGLALSTSVGILEFKLSSPDQDGGHLYALSQVTAPLNVSVNNNFSWGHNLHEGLQPNGCASSPQSQLLVKRVLARC